jgi:predicted HTH domain antitoxin
MALIIQLPSELEQTLRREFGDLDQAAKEAFLVQLYRQDKITQYELSQALGFERFETDALLKKHNVTEDLPTAEELADDLRRLTQVVSK